IVDKTLQPKPNRLRQIAETTGRNVARLQRSTGQHLDLQGQLVIVGSSPDDLDTALNEIDMLLAKAADYASSSPHIGKQIQLTYQPEGATNAVIYNVLDGDIQYPGLSGTSWKNLRLPGLTLTLVCEPFG